MRIFKIKSVKEIFIWILTAIIQYFLEIKGSENGRFEIYLPSLSIYLGAHLLMLERTRKARQNEAELN